MHPRLKATIENHGALICALVVCSVFAGAAQVFSRPVPEPAPTLITIEDPFALTNPDAFDPAKRRTVKAMRAPRETAAQLAAGIDAATWPAPRQTLMNARQKASANPQKLAANQNR